MQNITLIFERHSHLPKQLDHHNVAVRSILALKTVLLKAQPFSICCVCSACGNTIPQSWSKTGSVFIRILCQASLSDLPRWCGLQTSLVPEVLGQQRHCSPDAPPISAGLHSRPTPTPGAGVAGPSVSLRECHQSSSQNAVPQPSLSTFSFLEG